jgi:hypothetical protein
MLKTANDMLLVAVFILTCHFIHYSSAVVRFLSPVHMLKPNPLFLQLLPDESLSGLGIRVASNTGSPPYWGMGGMSVKSAVSTSELYFG